MRTLGSKLTPKPIGVAVLGCVDDEEYGHAAHINYFDVDFVDLRGRGHDDAAFHGCFVAASHPFVAWSTILRKEAWNELCMDGMIELHCTKFHFV